MAAAITLITGASGGIGEALTRVAARAGRRLVLTARSAPRLNAVADAITAEGRARPDIVALDLGAAGAADRLAEVLAGRGLAVAELVNNAGYGIVGRLAKGDRADQVGMVDLNVRALTDLTIRFLPEIVAARGGVLNVASVASYLPGPGMAVYYASKAYVLSFSEALAQELKGEVRVTVLCPGPVPTGFQERANPGRGISAPSVLRMSALAVAEEGWRGFERGKRVVVPGFFNKLVAFIVWHSPRSIILPLTSVVATKRHGEAS
jgi:short-subunit dehydrogenase